MVLGIFISQSIFHYLYCFLISCFAQVCLYVYLVIIIIMSTFSYESAQLIIIHPINVISCGVCRGKDVSIENLHQGFTHVFESSFESTQGIAEYIDHRDHVEFANKLLPQLEKVLVIDYKPTKVQL